MPPTGLWECVLNSDFYSKQHLMLESLKLGHKLQEFRTDLYLGYGARLSQSCLFLTGMLAADRQRPAADERFDIPP